MTDNVAQSQVIPYLTSLSSLGYQFTVLSCEKPENLKRKRDSVGRIMYDAGISWQIVSYTKSPPIVATLFDYWQLIRQARRLHKAAPFSIVHCRSYLPAMIGLYLKNRFGAKFIFDMRGFWADERVDGGLWDLKNPVYKRIFYFFKSQEKKFLQNASRTVSLTHKGKEEILKWGLDILPGSIDVIPCCCDEALFDPSAITEKDKSAIREQLGIRDDDFVLTYLGSVGTWYLLDEMIDFFIELKNHKPASKFLFITSFEHSRIIEACLNKGVDKNDIIIQSAARGEVPLFLSLSTWSIFFIKPSYSKMSSSPIKQGEIMAMGIPLICNSGIGDTDEIVQESSSGVVAFNFDYKTAISQMADYNIPAENIRAGALSRFALHIGVSRYNKIYQELSV